jgi:hypothetical protein
MRFAAVCAVSVGAVHPRLASVPTPFERIPTVSGAMTSVAHTARLCVRQKRTSEQPVAASLGEKLAKNFCEALCLTIVPVGWTAAKATVSLE